LENLKETNHLKDLEVNGRIMLEWILKEGGWGVRGFIFIWLKTGIRDRFM
jgi:hypothetical protein